MRPLIIRAYQLQSFQLAGGPNWLDSEHFDLTAKAEGEVTAEQINVMLQSLLADRFKLVVHHETRQLPAFHLTKARSDGKLGPALKPAAVDCGPTGRGRTDPAPTGPRVLPVMPASVAKGVVTGCRQLRTPGWLMVAGQPMTVVAAMLTLQLGQSVIDRTGLTGNFDFSVSYMPEDRSRPAGPLPEGFPPINPDAPSLFTALREQLGLKLDPQRAPVDVLVIDQVEHPTEN